MRKARRYTVWLVHLASVIALPTIICQSQSNSSINGPEPLPASESMAITSNVQEVNLSLVVTDKKGHFVPNLTANDIAIQDNAKPPDKITYFNQFTDLPPGAYQIEPFHTQVVFSVVHFGLTNFYGMFSGASGALALDSKNLGNSKLTMSVPISTINTITTRMPADRRTTIC